MAEPVLTIHAGAHDRRDCPLEFKIPGEPEIGDSSLVAVDGARINLQAAANGWVRCVVPALKAGEARSYRLQSEPAGSSPDAVSVQDTGQAVEISIDSALATRYIYGSVPSRPYFHPVYAPGQLPVTRAYPMEADVAGETHDHPHHRSLWIAHGEVNEADNWSEAPGHARTIHERFDEMTSGPVAGSFASRSRWTRSDGTPILNQLLTVTAWAGSATRRILDFRIELHAAFGPVHFGDTKEGGILSVRVASEMDVPRTGRITNVYGGIDEAETWGKASHWCDYSGAVSGKRAGIAVFDHPHSFRYPTHWHVRDYGLMTANPFAYAAYSNGVKNGSHTLLAGETLSFRYRVVLHAGSCDEASVASLYLDYVAPPRVTVAE